MANNLIGTSIQKYLLGIILLCLGLLSGLLLIIIVMLLRNKPPNFFPLNNSQGNYKITKNCPEGQGWEENTKATGDFYCVEYKGTDVFGVDNGKKINFFRVTVGKSKINLSSFLNKNVINIKGKYSVSSSQCINSKCGNINGPLVVLDIDNLEVAE